MNPNPPSDEYCDTVLSTYNDFLSADVNKGSALSDPTHYESPYASDSSLVLGSQTHNTHFAAYVTLTNVMITSSASDDMDKWKIVVQTGDETGPVYGFYGVSF